jgi:hypothetical protein
MYPEIGLDRGALLSCACWGALCAYVVFEPSGQAQATRAKRQAFPKEIPFF